ncbi:hypothetical protein KEM48_004160 [Puccinia striiformis f. sp. tritici PST-130]|nr:hypothetical protein KEM48_004160 [Puccinia striiformis f. sp. tritici PST-130]
MPAEGSRRVDFGFTAEEDFPDELFLIHFKLARKTPRAGDPIPTTKVEDSPVLPKLRSQNRQRRWEYTTNLAIGYPNLLDNELVLLDSLFRLNLRIFQISLSTWGYAPTQYLQAQLSFGMANISNLPNEVLGLILQTLISKNRWGHHDKSMGELRLVCRRWSNLLTDQHLYQTLEIESGTRAMKLITHQIPNLRLQFLMSSQNVKS